MCSPFGKTAFTTSTLGGPSTATNVSTGSWGLISVSIGAALWLLPSSLSLELVGVGPYFGGGGTASSLSMYLLWSAAFGLGPVEATFWSVV